MNVPDYVSPVVGYRAWNLDPRGLKSLNGEFWRPNQKLQAACGRFFTRFFNRHTPPHGNCSCGIYAAKSFNQLRRIGYAKLGVHGEVYLWGTVVEHKLGWRAQFAYPKTLVVPESLLLGGVESLKILIEYGVDLFVAGEKRNILLWTKQCGGFDHIREVAARLAQSLLSESWEELAAAQAYAKETYQPHLRAIRVDALVSRIHQGSERCPFCRSTRFVFDNGRDHNLCADCGAIETTKGWTQGTGYAA